MFASKRNQKQGLLKALVDAATDFHGHLGPFLVLGVRTGLVGLRELGLEKASAQLHVTVMLKYAVPLSCILDGIQTTTKCTVGNKRLVWKDSKEIEAEFLLMNSGRQVEVTINPAIVKELGRKLVKKTSEEEVRQLALEIASRPESELFLVRHK